MDPFTKSRQDERIVPIGQTMTREYTPREAYAQGRLDALYDFCLTVLLCNLFVR